jgi:hypothetical protein
VHGSSRVMCPGDDIIKVVSISNSSSEFTSGKRRYILGISFDWYVVE